jgi:hypothetical protein
MQFTGGSSHTPENRKGDLVSEKDPVEKKKKIKAEAPSAEKQKKAKKTENREVRWFRKSGQGIRG